MLKKIFIFVKSDGKTDVLKIYYLQTVCQLSIFWQSYGALK